MFSVGNMLSSFGIDVFLCQPKVNHVNDAHFLGRWAAKEKVFRLDVAIYEVFGMDIFNAIKLKRRVKGDTQIDGLDF